MKLQLATQDHAELAGLWGDFIDWNGRLQNEGPFLVEQLNKHGCRRIFDACLGDGVDTIYLIERGFLLISNERDPSFQERALKNADARNIKLMITQYDWRGLNAFAPYPLFDAIICLGNSFTYLFESEDRKLVLRNFHALLKPGGILIVDERNYPYMLANREKILNGQAPASSRRSVYTGQKVIARPIVIEDSLVVMHYRHKETQEEGRLSFYPFKEGELRSLLEKDFEHLDIYSDFSKGHDLEAAFYQHICRKN